MKSIIGGIIGGIIVLSIILLLPAQLEESQEFVQKKIIKNNKIINLSTYDCAKNYDKWRTFMDTDRNSYGYSSQSSVEYFIYGHYELLENRCFISVKSWAHESDYEPLIWSSDWENLSYQNQMYLGEISCTDSKICENIKEQRDQYWNYLKSKT